ncbi:efflux RND transporter periplasmic adaptor subunit [Arenibaculum pallidiluteum]|uniref:efflux RND transporter periplasmic adaptor subunit n=1 Tax=Arenibaculum pallidiluteum TaxID=2812559 RepID=UPI001A95FB54|nr:efflux RND transporter periplasmic adaptor subunit [Arenibaculum pallidiluteum]
MRKGVVVSVVILGLGAAGFMGYRHFGEQYAFAQSAPRADVPKPSAGPTAIAVEVARVQVSTVLDEIGAVGTLQADESVVIAPEIDGRVAAILLEEGAKVEAGQVLVRLDDAILRAELAQAQSNLTLAQANYDRANTLFQQRTGTQRARDEAVAALQSARASFELARTRLDKTTIRAPFSGVLGFRSVGPGHYLSQGEQLVMLQSLDPLKVDFRVPETRLSEIRTGQPVKVTVDALPGREFTGEIYATDPQVDVNGRAIRLRAKIPNGKGELRPGLFARVTVVSERRENSLLVPEGALVPQGAERYVYRVVDGKAAMVKVRIGQRQAGQVEVLEGLRPDDVVVTAGQQRLRNGVAVEIVNPDARV